MRIAHGIGATVGLSVAWFAGLPITAGNASRRKRWRDRIFRAWARQMLAATRVRVRVQGDAPRGPCVLVANHLGYLDVFVIAAHVDCVFVSMAELARWPMFGFMARQLGTVFIDRSRKRELPEVNAGIERAFDAGHVVVVFPEGRHSRGAGVLPFRPSLLEPAAASRRPVAFAVLRYTTAPDDPPAARAIPWIEMSIVRHALDLLVLDPIDATLDFGSDSITSSDRKELASKLHAEVAGRFWPLDGAAARN